MKQFFAIALCVAFAVSAAAIPRQQRQSAKPTAGSSLLIAAARLLQWQFGVIPYGDGLTPPIPRPNGDGLTPPIPGPNGDLLTPPIPGPATKSRKCCK
jgi:hypothetical protein